MSALAIERRAPTVSDSAPRCRNRPAGVVNGAPTGRVLSHEGARGLARVTADSVVANSIARCGAACRRKRSRGSRSRMLEIGRLRERSSPALASPGAACVPIQTSGLGAPLSVSRLVQGGRALGTHRPTRRASFRDNRNSGGATSRSAKRRSTSTAAGAKRSSTAPGSTRVEDSAQVRGGHYSHWDLENGGARFATRATTPEGSSERCDSSLARPEPRGDHELEWRVGRREHVRRPGVRVVAWSADHRGRAGEHH